MKAAAAALVATVALAGCGTEDVAETGEQPRAEPAVLDCGSYENRNDPPTTEQEEANQCVIEALEAGRPATLVATLMTIEGDPIVHNFTVKGAGEVDLLVDATQDAYGGGRQAYTCTDLSQENGRLSWTGCTEAEAAG